MKKLFFVLSLAAVVFSVSSCSRECTCAATKGGATIDSFIYEDLSGSECEAKVDETLQQAIDKYGAEAMIGVEVSCSHL